MADLNPKIEAAGAGKVRMTWTPDPTCFGYRFYVNDHAVSKSTKPGQASTTFAHDGQPTAYGIAASYEQNAETVIYPAPPPTGWTVAPPVGPFTAIDGGNIKVSDPRAYKVTSAPVTLSKLHVKSFLGVGIRVQQGYPPTVPMPGRTIVEDCIVEDIATDPPLASDGTAEACFWFGNPTTAKRLKGVNLRGWSVLETTSRSLGSLIEDCDFTGGPNTVVVYVEHHTVGTTFRRIRTVGGYCGFKFEWSYKQTSYGPGYVGFGEMEGCWENVIEDCDIYCPGLNERSGVWVDAGNHGNVFRRCRFHGPGQALWLPNNLVDPSKPNRVEDCIFDQDGPDVVYHNRRIGWDGQ